MLEIQSIRVLRLKSEQQERRGGQKKGKTRREACNLCTWRNCQAGQRLWKKLKKKRGEGAKEVQRGNDRKKGNEVYGT